MNSIPELHNTRKAQLEMDRFAFLSEKEKCEISRLERRPDVSLLFQSRLRFANIPGLEQHLVLCKPSLCLDKWKPTILN